MTEAEQAQRRQEMSSLMDSLTDQDGKDDSKAYSHASSKMRYAPIMSAPIVPILTFPTDDGEPIDTLLNTSTSPIVSSNEDEESNTTSLHVLQHLHALSNKTRKNDKIIDSGASCGISAEIPAHATSIKPCKNKNIAFGGESKFALPASNEFQTLISAYDLHVKDAKIDIISCSQADRQGFATLFYNSTAAIWSPFTGVVYETATLREDGLYHVDKTPRFKHLGLDLKHFSSPQ